MVALQRNNVIIRGTGTIPIMFAHGYGCDQNMWRYVSPAFEDSHKVILFDHVGAGKSDLKAYDRGKYGQLAGYAADIIEVADELNLSDAIFVGHSVSAMMGIIAAIKRPDLFSKLILVAPSPYYINDGGYVGGFTRQQIEELLEALDNNHLGWSSAMAPVIMANADRPELADELRNSFCRTDPAIAKHFAQVTFLSDCRDMLSSVDAPCLILQCSNDMIAPTAVGEYLHREIKNSRLVVMKATGHCPNLSAPEETIIQIREFLTR